MSEEKPTTENQTDSSEHIYLDVIHIASRPSSKKSLCSTTNGPTIEKGTSKPEEKKRKSGNASSCVLSLIAAIIFLSAVCCVLGALYVIEKRHSAMLASENSREIKNTPSTNCTTPVSKAPANGNCAFMESELEKRKNVYKNKCSLNRSRDVQAEDSQDHNTTPIKCTTESLQLQTSSDTVRSRGAVKMASATVCFWCKSTQGVIHYVAYIEPNNGAGFDIVEEKSSSGTIDISWHSFCYTWSTGEENYKFYKDGKLIRGREINREKHMTGGGTWVLGLRSNTSPGKTSVTETKQYGEITAVNVWDRILRKRELNEVMRSCTSKYKGNVKSWQDFKSGVKRNVKVVKSTCCNTQ